MMQNVGKLAGKTIFISGASRGIGKAIALKCAKDGANIVIAAKTAEPHPKLPGTIYTAAKEVEDAGGKCLPCLVDIRHEDEVEKAVDAAANKFGGIDILVNNASAISLTGTEATSMKKYDLMNGVNGRGTYVCSKFCLPHLKKGNNPHILNISPPLNMKPKWFAHHVAYTMAKYGMSMCALGMAEEFKDDGIAVNALWPQTAIYTAAMQMLGGGDSVMADCRKDTIMADAAYAMLIRDSRKYTGNFAIDEDVLREEGITDFEQYNCVPGSKPMPDFFLDVDEPGLEERHAAKMQEGASGGDAQLAETFKKIGAMINEDIIKTINGTYSFDLGDVGEWHLDLKLGTSGSSGKGSPPSEANVTFTMSSEDFVKMFEGKLNPTQAFMAGTMKIKGDLGLALKLEKLMKQARSHL